MFLATINHPIVFQERTVGAWGSAATSSARDSSVVGSESRSQRQDHGSQEQIQDREGRQNGFEETLARQQTQIGSQVKKLP